MTRRATSSHRWLAGLVAASALASAPRLPAQAVSTPAASELERFGSVVEFLRARNTRDYALTGPSSIDESLFVELGGIPQWISIRGEDRRNPVLLLLHGGPGDATSLYTYATFRPWLKTFTVVQWDQRGAGHTLGRNPGVASTITLERMTQDGVELAELLRKRLDQPKVVLLGHSFGSILGVLIAKARPELFYAFVGTGQVGDPETGYTVAYHALVAKAEKLGAQDALGELKAVGPPPYKDGRGFGVQRTWSNRFEGADRFLPSMIGFALSAPGATIKDVNDWLDGQGVSAEQLVPKTAALKASALAGEFALPVVVIQGDEDFTTPTSLAQTFVTSLRAPRKSFVTIPGGHCVMFMRPDSFLDALTTYVLPLTR
jgi:pimeloyl-ACP methyl ester carboxylesterase